MATIAYHLKEAFRPSVGLDRSSCVEMYHVVGIEGWTRTNTTDTVFAYVGVSKGQAHPDPGLSGAICTSITLADEPFINPSTGALEALVAVAYDSNRRWGGASTFESGIYGRGSDMDHRVPCFSFVESTSPTQTSFAYVRNDFLHPRGRHTRVENRNATGITETTKAVIMQYVGSIVYVGGLPYMFDAPQIIRLRTNAVLLRYMFITKSPIQAFEVTSDGRIGIPIPALKWMEEYVVNNDIPEITVKNVNSYGIPVDANDLPYWNSPI
jgi:hypothetical protein